MAYTFGARLESDPDASLYISEFSVVSGDATATEYLLQVSGDCEVNLTLAIDEP